MIAANPLPHETGAHRLAVVRPDAVPPGATVVAHVIQLPAEGTRPALTAVPAADEPHREGLGGNDVRTLATGVRLDLGGRVLTVDGRPVDLTRREFDLLVHLSGHPGRVVTRDTLLESVWGHADPRWVAPRTVDVHVARVRRKLGAAQSRPLQTVRGVGYRWVP